MTLFAVVVILILRYAPNGLFGELMRMALQRRSRK
jgi:hypothetical protein